MTGDNVLQNETKSFRMRQMYKTLSDELGIKIVLLGLELNANPLTNHTLRTVGLQIENINVRGIGKYLFKF